MSEEIVNKVSNSKLVTIDLEDYYPEGERLAFDISPWLAQGLILKEKDFRHEVEQHNWGQYKGKYIALFCQTEAIIPSWAYMLVATKMAPFAKKTVVGNLELLEAQIFQELIAELDTANFKDKPVIIKGCSNKPIPDTAAVLLIEKLLPVAKSLMFGEACSTVPLYKRKA